MKSALNIGFAILMVLPCLVTAQSTSEKLKSEQKRLENKISSTKSLLNKTRSIKEKSLGELQLIENQIQFREQLVYNFDNQVRGAEMKMAQKDTEIKELQARMKRLRLHFKRLLLYAYKHRNKFGRMMYIFSANDYHQAFKRSDYLQRIAEIQKKQFLMIRQHQGLIKEELKTIELERQYKLNLLTEKQQEKYAIEQDKKRQEETYKKLKQEESKLNAQLREDERKKEVLKQRISAAIKKEIAEAEAKRKKAEAEAAKKKTSSTPATASKDNSPGPNAPKATPVFTETKESVAMGKSFEGSKGRLPWPVDKGSITERFGKNAHPTLDNVYTNNNGIDISAPKGAQVRAVFEGEVTSVLNIPGAGKVVIIKHGNYRTVYSNLQETYVKTGSKVTTKQSIGTLLPNDDSSVSVAHFEVHVVNGTMVQCLNPSLWISH